MTELTKYELLVTTYNQNSDRIKVATESLLGLVSNGNAPISAYIICNDDGTQTRIEPKDMPLNDLEKSLIGDDQFRVLMKTFELPHYSTLIKYLPLGRHPKAYETKAREAHRLLSEHIAIQSANNADVFSLQNTVMGAKLEGRSLEQAEYDTILSDVEGKIDQRIQDYNQKMTLLEKRSRSILEIVTVPFTKRVFN